MVLGFAFFYKSALPLSHLVADFVTNIPDRINIIFVVSVQATEVFKPKRQRVIVLIELFRGGEHCDFGTRRVFL